MGILLVGSQRDEVYQYLLVDLGGVADMTTLIRGGELNLAQRLRERFVQDMHLLDQIGWNPKGRQQAYAITLASDDIRAIFQRLLAHAIQLIEQPPTKSAQVLRMATSVAETARMVLGELPGGTRGPRP
jgi:hypothetical protein